MNTNTIPSITNGMGVGSLFMVHENYKDPINNAVLCDGRQISYSDEYALLFQLLKNKYNMALSFQDVSSVYQIVDDYYPLAYSEEYDLFVAVSCSMNGQTTPTSNDLPVKIYRTTSLPVSANMLRNSQNNIINRCVIVKDLFIASQVSDNFNFRGLLHINSSNPKGVILENNGWINITWAASTKFLMFLYTPNSGSSSLYVRDIGSLIDGSLEYTKSAKATVSYDYKIVFSDGPVPSCVYFYNSGDKKIYRVKDSSVPSFANNATISVGFEKVSDQELTVSDMTKLFIYKDTLYGIDSSNAFFMLKNLSSSNPTYEKPGLTTSFGAITGVIDFPSGTNISKMIVGTNSTKLIMIGDEWLSISSGSAVYGSGKQIVMGAKYMNRVDGVSTFGLPNISLGSDVKTYIRTEPVS